MFKINGKLTEKISIKDRAVQYGDGVFETIAVDNFVLKFWNEHYQRLNKGCRILKIKCPKESFLKKEINNFIKRIKNKKFVLKIIISRGKGGRGYNPPKKIIPTRILGIYNWPNYPVKNYTKGIKINICKTRIALQPSLSRIKHLNRLEQILARSEWQNNIIAESLMMDLNNNIIEGTMSNIFGIKKNIFYTPDLLKSGVEGVMRSIIIKLLKKKKKKIIIKNISHKELLKFEEVFICNSIFGIWPVIKIQNKKFIFGKETRELMNFFD